MNLSLRVVATTLALVLMSTAVGAADQPVTGQIEARNKAFVAAYEEGDVPKMKGEIAKAVALGEKNGLATSAVMADTYVLAAVLEVDGNENPAAGVKYFVKALKIKADFAIPKGMGTSTVKAALKQARAEAGATPSEAAATPAAAAKTEEPAKEPAEEPAPQPQKLSKKEQEKLARQQAAEQARAEADAKKAEAEAKRAEADAKKKEKELAAEQARTDADAKKKEKEKEKEQAQVDRKDKEKADKALAEAASRAQQLEKEKGDRDKQLADAKARVQQADKDKADKDKQLADAKARIQQLETRAQQAEKDRADRDKQLADAKTRIQQLEGKTQQLEGKAQQLEKDRGERDKQLADAKAREGKEREAREKVERERQVADAKELEAETRKKQEQQNRERLFAGPELPTRISEPLLCAVPDEAPLRTDLFVHCAARPNVKARAIVFYYRVAGSAQYYSVPMERTSKGWHAALVPGVRVVGKVMQYYAEALDAREAVVARNGKESSPNILTLKPGAPRG